MVSTISQKLWIGSHPAASFKTANKNISEAKLETIKVKSRKTKDDLKLLQILTLAS